MTTSILPNKMKRLEQTEIGLLPVEWDVSSLDAVSEKIQDGTHFSPKLGGGEFLYVTSKNIGPGYLKLDSAERISEKEHRAIYRRCDTSFGDIWLTKDGVNTGNAAINTLEEEVSLLSSVAFIRVNPRVYSANFCLQYLLSDSCKRVIAQAVSGNAITRLTLEKIRRIQVPVPPLPEQRAIAEALGDVDALVAAQEKLIAKKRAIKTATMQRLLTGKQRLPGFGEGCGYKQTEIGVIPEDWQTARVGDVGIVQLGRQRAPQHHSGAYMRPYLRVANVFENRIDTTDVLYMNFSPAEFEKYRLFPGDILLNEGQSRELVGRPAMFEGQLQNACFQNTLVRFKSGPEIDSHFALQILLHCYREGRLAEISRQTTSIAHLGADRFAKLEIPLPPLEEQKRLAAVARDFEDEVSALEKRLAKTKAIKQGMMQELLTGRTRLV